MSKELRYQPCPDCGSKDALTKYPDGHTYCFSCSKYNSATSQGATICHIEEEEDNDYISIYLDSYLRYKESTKEVEDTDDTLGTKDILGTKDTYNNFLSTNNLRLPKVSNEAKEIKMDSYRKLNKDTLKHYGVTFRVNKFGEEEVVFPYGTEANKIRKLKTKDFYSEGMMTSALPFGWPVKVASKYITITEGEIDAMSVFQMLNGMASISIKSSSSPEKDLKDIVADLNKYDRIYLCLDMDKQGQKATAKIAALFNPNKIYHVKMNHHKDANEYLMAGDQKLFVQEWWNSKPYMPNGIVGDLDSFLEILSSESSKPVATYPYHKLQDMTYGIRSSEVVLFTAQEKVGKTEVMRSIEHHLLKTTDYNIGIIHLEEDAKRVLQGIATYELKKPVHLPDSNVSTQDVHSAVSDAMGGKNRVFIYKHFGSDDPQVILDKIRYMVVACDCKFVFLDHITMLVTGFKNEDERKTLDQLSTNLAMMTRELDFTLFLVSHVNDDGKTRGSRNISKIADLIVHMDRDLEAATISERNKTRLMIKGNRFAGLSGPSSTLWFDPSTFTYKELDEEDLVEKDKQTQLLPEQQRLIEEVYKGSDSGSDTLWVQAPREEEEDRPSIREADAGLHEAVKAATTTEL